MSMASAPTAPEDMTATQLERRQRILAAVIELIDEGADEGLQVKDIGDRAGVALGTVYRYFSSKDHIVAAALVEWAGTLATRPARRRRTATGPPADRLEAVLRQALRAYQLRPAWARVLVTVATSTDPFASQCYRELGDVVFPELRTALVDVEPDRRERILAVIGAVWYHCLVEWVNGRMSIAAAGDTLASTCHLLLDESGRR